MSCPWLSEQYKDILLIWIKNRMDFGEKWRGVIFSNEKKFYLNGPNVIIEEI